MVSSLHIAALSASVVLLAACVPEDSGKAQLPADYVPGAIYGVDQASCLQMGGSMTTDGNGLKFCHRGSAKAVFVCDDGTIVALIERQAGSYVLHGRQGLFEDASQQPAASGTLFRSKSMELHSKGNSAVYTQDGVSQSCKAAG